MFGGKTGLGFANFFDTLFLRSSNFLQTSATMQTFTTILAASAFIASVSGSPLTVRSTCGAAPSSSGSQTPIAQPTGIATAADCQAQCEANGSCQSFVFGVVDGADKFAHLRKPSGRLFGRGVKNTLVIGGFGDGCGDRLRCVENARPFARAAKAR